MLSTLQQNTNWEMAVGITSLILTIVSLISAVYFYRKSKEQRNPLSYYVTFREIDKLYSDNSEIRISFRDEIVERVYTTYVWFWNAGRKPILPQDVRPNQKLDMRISDDDYTLRILDYRIVTTSRPEVGVQVARASDNMLTIAFEFLDRNDGWLIELQHTGDYFSDIEYPTVILGTEGIHTKVHPNTEYGRQAPDKRFLRRQWEQRTVSIVFCTIFLLAVLVWIYKEGLSAIVDRTHSYIAILLSYITSPEMTIEFVLPLFVVLGLSSVIWSFLFMPWTSPFPFPKTIEYNFERDEDIATLFSSISSRLFRNRDVPVSDDTSSE